MFPSVSSRHSSRSLTAGGTHANHERIQCTKDDADGEQVVELVECRHRECDSSGMTRGVMGLLKAVSPVGVAGRRGTAVQLQDGRQVCASRLPREGPVFRHVQLCLYIHVLRSRGGSCKAQRTRTTGGAGPRNWCLSGRWIPGSKATQRRQRTTFAAKMGTRGEKRQTIKQAKVFSGHTHCLGVASSPGYSKRFDGTDRRKPPLPAFSRSRDSGCFLLKQRRKHNVSFPPPLPPCRSSICSTQTRSFISSSSLRRLARVLVWTLSHTHAHTIPESSSPLAGPPCDPDRREESHTLDAPLSAFLAARRLPPHPPRPGPRATTPPLFRLNLPHHGRPPGWSASLLNRKILRGQSTHNIKRMRREAPDQADADHAHVQ